MGRLKLKCEAASIRCLELRPTARHDPDTPLAITKLTNGLASLKYKCNFRRELRLMESDAMKCPVCEQFGRELRFENRRLLDQHSSRFHGLSITQLEARDQPVPAEPLFSEANESVSTRRFTR